MYFIPTTIKVQNASRMAIIAACCMGVLMCRYWAFSIDEMALYDLPATIDYVLQLTGHKRVRNERDMPMSLCDPAVPHSSLTHNPVACMHAFEGLSNRSLPRRYIGADAVITPHRVQ